MGGGRGGGREREVCAPGLYSLPFVSNLLETYLPPFVSQRSVGYVRCVKEGELDHADGGLFCGSPVFFVQLSVGQG